MKPSANVRFGQKFQIDKNTSVTQYQNWFFSFLSKKDKPSMKYTASRLVVLLVLFITVFSVNMNAQAWTEGYAYNFYGARNYLLHLPKGFDAQKTYPLVVALHGCLQDPRGFAGGARLKQYADEYQAIIVVPNQHTMYNPYKCWNWFYVINQGRSGEPAIVLSIIEKLQNTYKIDQERIYAMGMSAGAGIANTLGNCYPEIFRAIGGHHGIQHKATENPALAQDVFYRGPKISPQKSAEHGYRCQGGQPRAKVMPALSIQGDRGVMDSTNSRAVEAQFLAFNDLLHNGRTDSSLKLDRKTRLVKSDEHYDYEVFSWVNAQNKRIVERVEIIGLGHSWSGGDNNFDWNDPKGPEATGLIFEFFRHHGL
jgi:poly(hydroxyalkanoate) depolymerase family esterase